MSETGCQDTKRSPGKESPLKVLIVDDSDDHVRLLVEFLKLCSVTTEPPRTVSDGESALDLLGREEFDCVLLDFELPGINGVEVLKRVKKADPQLAVVMVTAKGNEELAVEAMKSGAMDYLVKGSVQKQTLERVLLNLKERRELHRKVRRQEERLLQVERERVLMESIGAACHHFSQPITSLLGRLELLISRNPSLDEKDRELLEECLECSRKLESLLYQFQRVKEYRTVPYTDKINIIDIE